MEILIYVIYVVKYVCVYEILLIYYDIELNVFIVICFFSLVYVIFDICICCIDVCVYVVFMGD